MAKTKTIPLDQIKFKELVTEIKRLNGTGLLEKEIGTVGNSKEAMVEAFVVGVQSIGDDAEGNWKGPDETGEYYNKIVVADAPPAAEVKADGKKDDKKTDKKKAGKTKKEKKDLPPHKTRLEVIAETIRDFKKKNIEIAEIIVASEKAYGSPLEAQTKKQLDKVLKTLVVFGLVTISADGAKITKTA